MTDGPSVQPGKEDQAAASERMRRLTPRWLAMLIGAILIAGIALALRVAGIAHYSDQSFEFDYPSSWQILHEPHQYGLHGTWVRIAVGTGEFDSGCTETPSSVSCGNPGFVANGREIVVAYYFTVWLGPIHPQPTPALTPNETWTELDGRSAILRETSDSVRFHFPGAPEYIEAHWGVDAGREGRAQVDRLLHSFRWLELPTY